MVSTHIFVSPSAGILAVGTRNLGWYVLLIEWGALGGSSGVVRGSKNISKLAGVLRLADELTSGESA